MKEANSPGLFFKYCKQHAHSCVNRLHHANTDISYGQYWVKAARGLTTPYWRPSVECGRGKLHSWCLRPAETNNIVRFYNNNSYVFQYPLFSVNQYTLQSAVIVKYSQVSQLSVSRKFSHIKSHLSFNIPPRGLVSNHNMSNYINMCPDYVYMCQQLLLLCQ